jgi:Insertion element 4 transposase N-terminal/Transposase DDE domain
VPRRGWVKPTSDQRITDHIALGVLTRIFPPALVDGVIQDTDSEEQRSRSLPSRLVVYYVLAMALFADADYVEVMRSLVEGLAWEAGWKQEWQLPTSSAITRARTRVGVKPLRELYNRGCVPLARKDTLGAWYRQWRVMSMDGTTLDIADNEGNDETYGRPGTGRGEKSAFPQLRIVAVAECGTRATIAAAMGACSTGEVTLAKELDGSLTPEMLLFADRNFVGFPLWQQMAATGAALCWRAKVKAVFPVLERLPDGSYISEIVGSEDKRNRHDVMAVRVIEYTVKDPGRPNTEEKYRLITTILDPNAAPAADLAALYAERWEFETLLDELKTHQRGPRIVLRSKTPDGVMQEAYGHLCTHYAIRALMHTTAHDDTIDPDRLSFTRALRATRRSVRAGLGVAKTAIHKACTVAATELLRELVPLRLRSNPRVVKRKMSGYQVKRAHHRDWPQPTLTPEQAVQILAPT